MHILYIRIVTYHGDDRHLILKEKLEFYCIVNSCFVTNKNELICTYCKNMCLPHPTLGSPTILYGQAQNAFPVDNTTLHIAAWPHLISSQGSENH